MLCTNPAEDLRLLEKLPQYLTSENYSVEQFSFENLDYSKFVPLHPIFKNKEILLNRISLVQYYVKIVNWYDMSIPQLEHKLENFFFDCTDGDNHYWQQYVRAKFLLHIRFFTTDPMGYREIFLKSIPSDERTFTKDYLFAFLQLKMKALGVDMNASALHYLTERCSGLVLAEINSLVRNLVFDLDWGTPEDPQVISLSRKDLQQFFKD